MNFEDGQINIKETKDGWLFFQSESYELRHEKMQGLFG